MNWRMVGDKKKPCRPNGDDRNFDPHDPANHLTHEQAAASPHPVGFVMRAEDGLFFLDLDKCHTAQGWSSEATLIWQSFTGAMGEMSQSGTGLHIMGRCDPTKLEDRRNKWDGWLEFYTDKRFIAFGPHGWNPIGGTYADKDWTDQLLHVVPQRQFLGDLPDGRDPSYTGPEDDDQLIDMMLRSSGGATTAFGGGVTVRDLWEANVPALAAKYPAYDGNGEFDRSSADAALMSHLAFWTGKDMPRMDRLFRRSALMREKYDKRADYRRDTIQGAARLCRKVYDRVQENKEDFGAFLTPTEQVEYFQGCVYVRDQHRILIPDGSLLKPEQFNATFGGHKFVKDADGSSVTRKAFEALTESTAVKFPKATQTVFRPSHQFQAMFEDGRINVYKPAEVRTLVADITPLMDLLRLMLPSENDRAVLLSWACAVVQNPGRKALWAPVLQGTEGNGKSMLAECMAYAIGEKFVHRPRSKELGSKFNSWMLNRLLIIVEEFHMSGRREMLDDLKVFITQLSVPIRDMQAVEAMFECPTNWYFATNHRDAVLKSRNDRRYATLFTAQQTRGDLPTGDFFPRLWEWLRGDGFAAVAHFLRNQQPDPRFDPFGNAASIAPITSTTEAAIAASTGGIEGEILEAAEAERTGFRGGWISTWCLDKLFRERNIRISRAKVGEMLRELGYNQVGRASRPIISEDAQRPMLWYRGTETNPTLEMYLDAQGVGHN